MTKAERRFVKSDKQMRWVQRCVTSPRRKQLLGVHWRWSALGQWYLKHDTAPESMIGFLSACDYLGVEWAVAENFQSETIRIA
jgi:hypothetical protein